MAKRRRSEYQVIRRKDIRVAEYQEKYGKKAGARFEKLWVWQKAYELMLDVHKICKTLPRDERFRLRDQIERSSSSVVDNIAEGYTSYYYNDKIKGFQTARKESGETQSHIREMSGKEYIINSKADDLIGRYEGVIRGINGFINFIREKRGAER